MTENPERQGAGKSANAAALRLLSLRQRSVFEITSRLKDKGFEPVEIDKTVAYLTDIGLLDDEKFAKALCESRARYKAWGPARIARDLALKGIEEGIIKKALSEAAPEEEAALEALKRWRRRNKTAEGPKARERAFRHLRARGFSSAAIMKALGVRIEIDTE
ncbi:MAG: hypothetical protein A2054_01005 [Deltaproteobacteria bacterium GWA2_55_10]|nr:MAG: hypothetical protein A2054_01005 [Deltaproteobacteria bacterium GWA2_55_10]